MGQVPLYDDDVESPKESSPTSKKAVNNNPFEGYSLQHNCLPKEWKEPKDLSIENIIGDIAKGVSTRHWLNLFCEFYAFVSMIEPSTIEEVLVNEHWVMAMHDELN